MKANCHQCGKDFNVHVGHYNRAMNVSGKVYCNRTCAGLGRRKNYTDAEKKEAKRLYDIEYSKRNVEEKKIKKHEYFKRTYDPQKAAIERKKKMPKHIEYCRQPEYRKCKKNYDKVYHSKKNFGEMYECAIILFELESILDSKKIKIENNIINKTQKRKREWQRQRL